MAADHLNASSPRSSSRVAGIPCTTVARTICGLAGRTPENADRGTSSAAVSTPVLVAGWIGAFIFPILGLVVAVYLLTQTGLRAGDPDARGHGCDAASPPRCGCRPATTARDPSTRLRRPTGSWTRHRSAPGWPSTAITRSSDASMTRSTERHLRARNARAPRAERPLASRVQYPPETVGGAREPSGPGRPAQVRSKARASRACLRAGSFRSGGGRARERLQMDRTQKEAAVAELTEDLKGADAIFAVDYRGISVTDAAELRRSLAEADAVFKVVKNRLAKRAADAAGTDGLDELLVGPTALTLINGDAVIAAKAISTFAREHDVLELQGRVHGRRGARPRRLHGDRAPARLRGPARPARRPDGEPADRPGRGALEHDLRPRAASSPRSPSRAWSPASRRPPRRPAPRRRPGDRGARREEPAAEEARRRSAAGGPPPRSPPSEPRPRRRRPRSPTRQPATTSSRSRGRRGCSRELPRSGIFRRRKRSGRRAVVR